MIRYVRPALALAGLLAFSSASAAQQRASVSGSVKDHAGGAVAGAEVVLLDARQSVVARTRTDAAGAFALEGVAHGSYLLVAQADGLGSRRTAVTAGTTKVALVLEPPRLSEEVTVTANPGLVEDVGAVSQPVNVITTEEVALRAKDVLAQVANGEVGIHLQRTSPTMSGIFVRGLTGAKVNVYLDGQRYSTGSARGGVNTFFNLLEPETVQTVEVLRGPSSAQYGSDAIGGSVQVLTRPPLLGGQGALSGTYGLTGGSADASAGGNFSGAWSSDRLAVSATAAARRVNTMRAGQGTDSHNAVTRFLGLDPELVLDEGRQPDTAFTQYGGQLKVHWAPSTDDRFVASYMRSQQDGGRRYDQLLGGDGNLVADLRNLMLDYASLRYSHDGFGPFDSVSLGYSYNAQREERVNQGGNGNPRAAINHEYEKTRVHGLQASLTRAFSRHTLLVGADTYREEITAPSFAFSPPGNTTAVRRGRVPDGARYRTQGVYVQDVWEAVPSRLKLVGNLRYSDAHYEQSAADSPPVSGGTLWPDDTADFSSVTFRAGAVVTPDDTWTFSANVSRGFRAPHITDLGTVGLTGSGFEVAPSELAGLGATVGSSAAATAVSTGRPAEQLDPEESLNYEAGIRFRRGVVDTNLVGFINDLDGNIQKVALILPPGAVGTPLSDQVVRAQSPTGAVFVPASASPVLVNANFDDARIWGIEHTLEVRPASDWTVGTVFTYINAEDRNTHLPPNIEGGTPAPEGWLRVRWSPAGRPFWIEPYVHAAARQDNLSTLDLEDRRTGAPRSRASITSFFNNGARARGLIGNGADGTAGTADDVLLATGETLPQVISRVLGTANSSSLFTSIPGYVTFNLRGGWRLGGAHELLVDVENITDRNYRGISWGMDAPGFGVYVRYQGRF